MKRRTSAATRRSAATHWSHSAAAFVAIASACSAATALAWPPQANVGTRFQNLGDSYFSQTGMNFGFSIPTTMPNRGSGVVGFGQGGIGGNILFQNGGQPAIPGGLGGVGPGASFGYAVKTPMGTMFFGMTSSLGSDRSNVSQSGSITVMNGGTGFLSDTSQSPFVTSVVPVVGGGGQSVLGERLQRLRNGEGTSKDPRQNSAPANPAAEDLQPAPAASADERAATAFDRRLAAAQDNAAGRPLGSLAEIRAQQAAEDQAVDEEYRPKFQMAQAALVEGKPGVARLYYQQVVRHANGALKQQAIDALKKLTPERHVDAP